VPQPTLPTAAVTWTASKPQLHAGTRQLQITGRSQTVTDQHWGTSMRLHATVLTTNTYTAGPASPCALQSGCTGKSHPEGQVVHGLWLALLCVAAMHAFAQPTRSVHVTNLETRRDNSIANALGRTAGLHHPPRVMVLLLWAPAGRYSNKVAGTQTSNTCMHIHSASQATAGKGNIVLGQQQSAPTTNKDAKVGMR
jgi:hypothetical protein